MARSIESDGRLGNRSSSPAATTWTHCCAALAAVCDDGDANIIAVPAATLQGPVSGSPVLVSTFFSLPGVGYEQAEYFVTGTASAYVNSNELQANGRWRVQADEQAQYRTRIVVNRPSDPAVFNGTVIVEWLNVSAGFDSAPDWGMLHTELIRSGYAWVGVSAQQVGVDALVDGSAAENGICPRTSVARSRLRTRRTLLGSPQAVHPYISGSLYCNIFQDVVR